MLGIARVCTCRYFPRTIGEGKYYTRVQCLAILPSHECNDSISKQCCLNWLINSRPNKATPTDIKHDWHTAKRKTSALINEKEQKAYNLKARVTLFTLESYLTARKSAGGTCGRGHRPTLS